MQFIDLGCCLNLVFSGYDDWLSLYGGIDISCDTIVLLTEYVQKKELIIGSLVCGSIHDTPYNDSTYDIGACLGVLKYFEMDFVKLALLEMHRILKPSARFVLDIPNFESPIFRITQLIEDHLGRTDKYNMPLDEFNRLIEIYFEVDKTEAVAGMIQYFLRCKK